VQVCALRPLGGEPGLRGIRLAAARTPGDSPGRRPERGREAPSRGVRAEARRAPAPGPAPDAGGFGSPPQTAGRISRGAGESAPGRRLLAVHVNSPPRRALCGFPAPPRPRKHRPPPRGGASSAPPASAPLCPRLVSRSTAPLRSARAGIRRARGCLRPRPERNQRRGTLRPAGAAGRTGGPPLPCSRRGRCARASALRQAGTKTNHSNHRESGKDRKGCPLQSDERRTYAPQRIIQGAGLSGESGRAPSSTE